MVSVLRLFLCQTPETLVLLTASFHFHSISFFQARDYQERQLKLIMKATEKRRAERRKRREERRKARERREKAKLKKVGGLCQQSATHQYCNVTQIPNIQTGLYSSTIFCSRPSSCPRSRSSASTRRSRRTSTVRWRAICSPSTGTRRRRPKCWRA